MLTSIERQGLSKILNYIPDSDLFCLADTVTKRLLNVSCKNDAVEAIISCVETPMDLLKRQKVTRKVLFHYVHSIKESLSTDYTKHQLVEMCLKEWRSCEMCTVEDCEDMVTSNYQMVESHCITPAHSTTSSLGMQFTQWFFPRLNELQEFGPLHFWPDCRLLAELRSPSNTQEITAASDSETASFLSSLVLNHRFFFHVNDSDQAVQCHEDMHGLVQIMACGVVHQFNNCIGMFEFAFGLVRNPQYDNNYKIKWVKLRLQTRDCREEIGSSVQFSSALCA